MTHHILEPFVRLVGRWRTARAIAHLDERLLEDAGLKVEKTPWSDVSIARRGYWTGRRKK